MALTQVAGGMIASGQSIASPTFTGTSTFAGGVANAYGFGVGTAVPSSGSGISFPATQSASTDANTLDDYEEGTWTPALSASGYTFTFPVQQGLYTKIGNCVTFKLYMTASVASGSGTVQGNITGLPFVASARNENYGGCSFFPDNGSQFFSRTGCIRTNNGASTLFIANGFGGSSLQYTFNWATLPATTEWEISGHYYI